MQRLQESKHNKVLHVVILMFFGLAFIIIGYGIFVTIEDMVNERDELIIDQQNHIADQERHMDELSTQLKSLQQQLLKADSVTNDMKATNDALKGDLESLKKERGILNKEITQLKKKISIAEEQRRIAERTTKLSTSSAKTIKVTATAYIAMCSEGCTGITATGIDVRHRTPKIIAVDPNVIPLGSVVELIVDGKSYGLYTAADTGGAIKGNKIDVLMKTTKEANFFGRKKNVTVKIVGKKKLSSV